MRQLLLTLFIIATFLQATHSLSHPSAPAWQSPTEMCKEYLLSSFHDEAPYEGSEESPLENPVAWDEDHADDEVFTHQGEYSFFNHPFLWSFHIQDPTCLYDADRLERPPHSVKFISRA